MLYQRIVGAQVKKLITILPRVTANLIFAKRSQHLPQYQWVAFFPRHRRTWQPPPFVRDGPPRPVPWWADRRPSDRQNLHLSTPVTETTNS